MFRKAVSTMGTHYQSYMRKCNTVSRVLSLLTLLESNPAPIVGFVLRFHVLLDASVQRTSNSSTSSRNIRADATRGCQSVLGSREIFFKACNLRRTRKNCKEDSKSPGPCGRVVRRWVCGANTFQV